MKRNRRLTGAELDTDGMLKAIYALATVMQLAIGGGEPFLCPDLAEIARRTRDSVGRFSLWLKNAKFQNPGVMLRVDCAAVFAMHRL
jgi:molybdenum cofactor biosynthesis enzyme MoaA